MLQKNIKIGLVILLVSLSAISFSFINSNKFEISKNLDLFATIFQELNKLYVDDINIDQSVKAGIDGMLTSLDPYTTFYPEEEISNYNLATTGKYGGIGALIKKVDDYVIISEPYEGFPAFKADLKAGDKILQIDGASAKDKNTNDISKMLKGKPGTAVNIKIERPNGQTLDKELTREEIKIESVPHHAMVEDGIGYILLTSFTERCSDDVSKALQALKAENDLKGIVLDLRGNPGGLLNEAVDVSSIFIPKGEEVVNTKGRLTDWDKSYKTRKAPADLEIPLAVLTSGSSASASEIVSGVMQDVDRGVVIGQRTFGKGLVQTTKETGYNTRVKLTTSKYYLPSGRCIQAIDYSGGYKDGADKVPDSLRTVFNTRNGRKVYDAGGIDPDIEVEDPFLANITITLISEDLIFDYATKYFYNHPTIADANKFQLTDQEFEDFVNFLSDKKYNYSTKSERILEKLKETAEKEGYMPDLDSEIKTLETKIKSDKQKDIYKFKDEIAEILTEEISSRYYYQKGRIVTSLQYDTALKEAVSVLKNQQRYQSILTGK